MRKKYRKQVAQYARQSRGRSIWRKLVRVMASVVVFCTTYALILPAITMEQTYSCGLEAHVHEGGCYETVISRMLTCAIEEAESEHLHEDGCYTDVETKNLLCNLEEHTHTDQCRSDPSADLETEEIWLSTLDHVTPTGDWAQDLAAMATTQIGYRESEKNYQVQADGTFRGYSRYGAWYGVPYGKWDAMFAAFCMHYAGIPQEALPFDANTGDWFALLLDAGLIRSPGERTPGPGDLVFFAEGESGISRVAVVTAVSEEKLTVVEGDSGSRVLEHRVDITGSGAPVAYVSMALLQNPEAEAGETDETVPTENSEATEPAQPERLQQVVETENYIVTVSYSPDLEIPAGAQLQVTEYPRDSEIFLQRCQEAGYELEWLLNIGFFLDGQEVPLSGAFDVVVTGKQGQNLGTDITHFSEEGAEYIDGAEETGEGVAFSTDGFSDFGGGNAQTRAAANYPLTTANPANLQTGVNYIIYAKGGSENQHILMGSDGNITPIQATTGYWTSPYIIGNGWELTPAQVGNRDISRFTWQVQRQNGNIYLVSNATGQRLNIGYGSLSLTSGGTALGFRTDGAATEINGGDPWLRYENNDWRVGWYNGTDVYFAAVTSTQAKDNYPEAVQTGQVQINRLRFFNLAENGSSGVSALAGCTFEIVGENGYTATVTSENDPEVKLPHDIPDGKYTITEISVPAGYIRDTEYTRSFEIRDGALAGDATIGTFINHNIEQLEVGKNAQVTDYANRIYRVDITADSHMRMYEMDPVDLLFVVDQSNSMLFPAGLLDTGKRVTLRQDGRNNAANMDALNLDKSEVYYVIADPHGTSTVWAVWHDGNAWMCQDASYYAKAYYNNDPGYQDDNEIVVFPTDRSYSEQVTYEDSIDEKNRSNGCGLGRDLGSGSLGKYIGNNGGQMEFVLYTATDKYNRLHYLEEALANLIYEMADVNDQNRITLTRFSRWVDEANCIGPLTLTPENAERLRAAVTSIKTSGGTRQDRALEHVYNDHLNDPADAYRDFDHTYTLLITDGAPVRSGDDTPNSVGGANDIADKNGGTIYSRIKGYAADVRRESQLMTVALGMESVDAGKQVLQSIASDGSFYCALDDAADLLQFVQKLLFESFRPKEEIEIFGDVVDEISDSFYPIAWVNAGTGQTSGRRYLLSSQGRDWVLPQSGDWLTLDGQLTTEGSATAAGQLLQREDGTYYVRWLNQNVTNGWRGTVYLKAKEDFIGGNAIDTNKSASVTVQGAAKEVESPTVNVRLLDLNEFNSEVTVYLGDTVNGDGSSPISLLREYYQGIRFTKLIADGGSTLNKVAATDADGLEDAVFYLKYAIGRDLTDSEWQLLLDGESLTFPYVYDNPSSHGDVGSFTISLSKAGASADYEAHAATHACHPGGAPPVENCTNPAETYTLRVVYSAYRLNQQGRPSANIHNGPAGPGTEVGTGRELQTGKGSVSSDNVHKVHVISGAIEIVKVIEDALISGEEQVFTFTLHRMEDGEDTSGDITKTIRVPAGSTQGAASILFTNLPRGTYVVTEAVGEDYAVKHILVTSETNCQSTPAIGETAQTVTFTMGNNVAGANVIGYSDPTDRFTDYVDPVNGVFGKAVFTNGSRVFTGQIPVQKLWDDGAETHKFDTVYLLLLKDGIPVLDDKGNARLLRLDASNNWQGAFTVVLADKDDKVTNYDYAVREVTKVGTENLYTWSPAVLENDGTTLLYYERALDDGQLAAVSGRSYIVRYEKAGDASWTVTNLHAVELPMTGGTGTAPMYTFGWLLILAAAAVWVFDRRRKGRREAVE